MATELQVGPGVATPDALLVRVGGEWVAMPADRTPIKQLSDEGMWSAAAIAKYCNEINMIGKRPDVIAERAEHIMRWNEMHEIAAEVYNADPHDDLTWREMFADDLPY